MPFRFCDTLHSEEIVLSSAQALSRAAVQKVQHAGLFLCVKSSAEMEDFYLFRRTRLHPSHSSQCQPADIFSKRNELVQDRDAGSMWPALASSFLWVDQPCRR